MNFERWPRTIAALEGWSSVAGPALVSDTLSQIAIAAPVIDDESRDADGLPPSRLRLLDSDGQETDTFLDIDSSTGLPRLFHSARLSADGRNRVSPLAERMLEELEEALPA